MMILRRVGKHARFGWGLARYARHRLSLFEAREVLKRRLESREEAFLDMARRCVYGYSGSPYLPLLRRAGCELGDLEREVGLRGLESTLERLYDEGVYVDFEEFKGRRSIVRGGSSLAAGPAAFDNPVYRPAFVGHSGGTTGTPSSVPLNLPHHRGMLPGKLVHLEAHGLLGAPTASWFGVLPDSTGLSTHLAMLVCGQRDERWFVPAVSRRLATGWRDRLVTHYAVAVTHLASAGLPWPEPVEIGRPLVIAEWMRQALDREGRCLLRTHTSKALRVALAAADAGIDLAGASFQGGGEPATPAKVEPIRRVGGRFLSTYYFTEGGGPLGLACAHPLDDNDNHFFKDSFALIQRPVEIPGSGRVVDGFGVTSLLSSTPKVLLNVEIDDFGRIERRDCGCELGKLGFSEHLRDIRSARKLTGEGVTLVGSDMIRILEEVLPERFGGSSLDYQLLEEEDESGLTRLSLLVSPEIRVDDENRVLHVVLQALREGSVDGKLTEAVWSQTGSLRIQRRRPIWTGRGKLMPLHSAREPRTAATASGPERGVR